MAIPVLDWPDPRFALLERRRGASPASRVSPRARVSPVLSTSSSPVP